MAQVRMDFLCARNFTKLSEDKCHSIIRTLMTTLNKKKDIHKFGKVQIKIIRNQNLGELLGKDESYLRINEIIWIR